MNEFFSELNACNFRFLSDASRQQINAIMYVQDFVTISVGCMIDITDQFVLLELKHDECMYVCMSNLN